MKRDICPLVLHGERGNRDEKFQTAMSREMEENSRVYQGYRPANTWSSPTQWGRNQSRFVGLTDDYQRLMDDDDEEHAADRASAQGLGDPTPHPDASTDVLHRAPKPTDSDTLLDGISGREWDSSRLWNPSHSRARPVSMRGAFQQVCLASSSVGSR